MLIYVIFAPKYMGDFPEEINGISINDDKHIFIEITENTEKLLNICAGDRASEGFVSLDCNKKNVRVYLILKPSFVINEDLRLWDNIKKKGTDFLVHHGDLTNNSSLDGEFGVIEEQAEDADNPVTYCNFSRGDEIWSKTVAVMHRLSAPNAKNTNLSLHEKHSGRANDIQLHLDNYAAWMIWADVDDEDNKAWKEAGNALVSYGKSLDKLSKLGVNTTIYTNVLSPETPPKSKKDALCKAREVMSKLYQK